jgi:hypothetical protein
LKRPSLPSSLFLFKKKRKKKEKQIKAAEAKARKGEVEMRKRKSEDGRCFCLEASLAHTYFFGGNAERLVHGTFLWFLVVPGIRTRDSRKKEKKERKTNQSG